MATALELIGVEAVVKGISAFERDATSVNRLLGEVDKTTNELGKSSSTAWGVVETASNNAFSGIAIGATVASSALAGLTGIIVNFASSFANDILKASAAVNLNDADVRKLGETISRVGATSAVDIGKIADASDTLLRSGISLTDVQNGVLDAVTKLSIASGGELGLQASAKLVATAMNAWGQSAVDAKSDTNALLAVANASSIGFGDLSTALQTTAPLAVSLHIPFNDLAAAIGVLGEAGVKGTIAGTALKTMFTRLADPSKLAAELQRQYGVSIYDAQGKVVPFIEVIRRLTTAFGDQAIQSGKLTEMQRNEASVALFGSRSVLDALAFANKGVDAYQAMQRAIASADVQKSADEIQNSLIPQLTILKNLFESFILSVGTPLVQSLTGGIRAINDFLRTLDPSIPKAFGDAFLSIFSTRSNAGIADNLRKAFGTDLGNAIAGIVEIIRTARDAITELLPVFGKLFSTIFGGSQTLTNFVGGFQTVRDTILTIRNVIDDAVVTLTKLFDSLQKTAQGSRLVADAIRAISFAPLLGIIIVLSRGAATIALFSAQLVVVSFVLAALEEAFVHIRDTSDGTFNGFIASVNTLDPVLKVILGTVGLLATAIGVRLGVVSIVSAITGIINLRKWIIAAALDVRGFYEAIGNALVPLAEFVTAAAIATIQTTLLGISMAIDGAIAIGTFVAGLTAAIPVIGGITAAMSPLLLGILAVAAVAALAYLVISTNFLGIRDAITNSLGVVISLIRDAFLVEIGIAVVVISTLINAFNIAVPAIINFVNTLNITPQSILAVVSSLLNLIEGAINTGAQFLGLSGIWNTVWTAIQNIASIAISGIIGELNRFLTALEAIPGVKAALDALGIAFIQLRDVGSKALVDLQGEASKQLAAGQITFEEWRAKVVSATASAKTAVLAFVNDTAAGFALNNAALAQNSVNWEMWSYNVVRALEGPSIASRQNGAGMTITPAIPDAPVFAGGFSSPDALSSGGGKKGGSGKNQADILADSFQKLLVGIRGNIAELSKFLATLEQADPGRLAGMVAALQSAKGLISDIADSYQRILAVQLAIATVQRDLDSVNLQIDVNKLANEQATFSLKSQILALDAQGLAIQQQLLPIRQAIAAVDKQIADAQRPNYQQQGQLLLLAQQELPIRQQIAALATEINRVEDKRVTLLQRQQELIAQQSYDSVNNQLTDTNTNLNLAWQSLNVPQILALEKQKISLTASVLSAQTQLTAIQRLQKITQQNNELGTIGYKLQQVALEDMLKPLDDQITAITNIRDASAAETAIIVNGLEQQKQKLQDLAAPMEAQLVAIANQTALINAQIAVINNQFAIANQQYEQKKLQDQVELANLKLIKDQEDIRYQALIADYANALTSSGAFTAGEAIETLKRLKFWSSSADAIANIVVQFNTLSQAADAATAEIAKIPTDIVVHVHLVTDKLQSFQYGGTVGGPAGKPQLIIAHGGEEFLGVGAHKVPLSSDRSNGNGATVVNNYTVNAAYETKQSPANIGLDLRALIAMSKH